MKIIVQDPNGGEHDLQSVIVEFATINNQQNALLGAYDQRLAAIEAMLGIEHPTADAQTDKEDE